MSILAAIADHLADLYPDVSVASTDELVCAARLGKSVVLLMLLGDECLLLHDAERRFWQLLDTGADWGKIGEIVHYALLDCHRIRICLDDPASIQRLSDIVKEWWQ